MSHSSQPEINATKVTQSLVTIQIAGQPLGTAETAKTTENLPYKLIYFHARGVVENVRVLLYLARIPYVDYRFPVDPISFERPEYDAAAQEGKVLEANMNRVPILEIRCNQNFENVVRIGQSKAIERFIARQHGFFGNSEIESARIDMLCEHMRDIKQKYCEVKVGKSGCKLKAAKSKFMLEELPKWMARLEKIISGNLGYAVGTTLSLADVVIQQNLRDYFDDRKAARASIDGCPKLQAIFETVEEAAAGWYATRPDTRF